MKLIHLFKSYWSEAIKSDADDNADPYVWRHKNTELPPAQIKPLLIFVL